MKHLGFIVGGAVLLLAAVWFGSQLNQPGSPLGSVAQSNDYIATTTAAGNQIADTAEVFVTGPGALGSMVITGANTGVVNFYNATTTNVLARTGQPATNTLWLATIPASTAAGTYTFDVNFYDGLLVEIIGSVPTSTITYRPY